MVLNRLKTYHLHINGIVQGVGFRPMIYTLATAMQLQGYVKNGSDGVHIYFNSSENIAAVFLQKIIKCAPKQSIITSSVLRETDDQSFNNFLIHVEKDLEKKDVLITPDTAVCIYCKNELHDISNQRYRYSFITCTQCGPRYSIINGLPYERHNSSMQKFVMCEKCKEEYENVQDRRFFSQTNSCKDCGVELTMHRNASMILSKKQETILKTVQNYFADGKIIAIKGIGGYLFMCDAKNSDAIKLLRERKHRPSKAFAVLYKDIEMIQKDFELNDIEKASLESKQAPIVLLAPKQSAFENLSIKNIAPGLRRLGVMIPYTPLLDIILNDYKKPLIATSANISGSPIIYKDEDALEYLFDIADNIVTYNREIVVPEDDSVIQFSPLNKQLIILRRSRGYAPSFLNYKPKTKLCIVAFGAHLKSTISLTINGKIFVTQFLGSGEGYESQNMYKNTLTHWLKLYDAKPDLILADKHPVYFSHQYALKIATDYGSKIKFIQHHKAHFAAVLAENNLIELKGRVLGIIWDGNGLGDDGNIWGGEFFIYDNKVITRGCHFEYFPVIAGDKMALEPRISAMCIESKLDPQPELFKQKFTETEWKNYLVLIKKSKLLTSSVGRMFDAVASVLELCDKQTYEGEAAMYLQALAEDYVKENGLKMDGCYFEIEEDASQIPIAILIRGIISDIDEAKSNSYIAAKFHYSLVRLIGKIAKSMKVDHICFSGGVFQNALLIDWIQNEYRNVYKLFFHIDMPPNDENISFGQTVFFDNNIIDLTEATKQKKVFN